MQREDQSPGTEGSVEGCPEKAALTMDLLKREELDTGSQRDKGRQTGMRCKQQRVAQYG